MERCGEEFVDWKKQEGREEKGKKRQEAKGREKGRKIRGGKLEKKKKMGS